MSNVSYRFEGGIGYGTLHDGTVFLFDEKDYWKIRDIKLYRNHRKGNSRTLYILDRQGTPLHSILFDCPKGMELDHISLDTLDNRSCNIRIATHQQNQVNQPNQRNNTSGFTGVRFYSRRGKFTARIKIDQKDIHLGYYETILEAVQARNVGMECMFGEYGRYNDVPPAPNWIRAKVISQCARFAELSLSESFYKAYFRETA